MCYVSPTGNDANDGFSPATAFATMQHAVDTRPVGASTIYVVVH